MVENSAEDQQRKSICWKELDGGVISLVDANFPTQVCRDVVKLRNMLKFCCSVARSFVQSRTDFYFWQRKELREMFVVGYVALGTRHLCFVLTKN